MDIHNFGRRGACRDFDYSVFPDWVPYYYPFFGPEGEKTGKPKEQREAIARSICSGCTVVEQCLQFALERETSSRVDGFFGGKSEDERKAIIRARVKQEVA